VPAGVAERATVAQPVAASPAAPFVPPFDLDAVLERRRASGE
jgi:hypothetical protein